MNCLDRSTIDDFLHDRLEPDTQISVTEHLNTCEQCQETVNTVTDSGFLSTQFHYREEGLNADLGNMIEQLSGRPPIVRTTGNFVPAPLDFSCLSAPLEPGDLGSLKHFRILRVLGTGGMGVVFKGIDTQLNRAVAIKVLYQSPSPDSFQRFMLEARSAGGLHHDNVVSLYSVHHEADLPPFMVMEYVDGSSIEQRIRDSVNFDPREAATICCGVAEGLKAAHQMNLVHRDIKPGNILIDDRSNRPRVVDFGIVRAVRSDHRQITQEGTILGTVCYMSPEQIWSPDNVDHRTDIYSLGVSMYEMLTGEVPFRGSVQSIIHQIEQDEPRSIRSYEPKVPEDLETIALKCLEKDRGRRYESSAALIEDLTHFLNGEPIIARPIGKLNRTLRWCRRKPAIAIALTLTLILAIAGPLAAFQQATLRHRAELAAKQIRQLQAEDFVERGRLAATAGNWRLALNEFTRALESGHSDPVMVRIEMVRALNALGETASARHEIEIVSAIPDSRYTGRIELIRADRLLASGDLTAKELISNAQAQKLEPSDRIYSRALLHQSPSQTIELLDQLNAGDYFHHQATGLIAMTLLQLGRIQEARDRARVGMLLYPDDPGFAIIMAIVEVLEGDDSAALATIEEHSEQLRPEQIQRVREHLTEIGSLSKRLSQSYLDQRAFAHLITDVFTTALMNLAQLSRTGATSGQQIAPSVIRVPISLLEENAEFDRALKLWKSMDLEGAIQKLGTMIENGSVRGEIHFTHALFLAVTHEWKLDRLHAAENSFLNAAEASSMWTPLRRESHYTGAMIAAGLYYAELKIYTRETGLPSQQVSANPPPHAIPHLTRGIEYLKKRLAEGPLSHGHQVNMYKLAFQAGEWNLGRTMLADMIKRKPDDLGFRRTQFILEYRSGHMFRAWQLAGEYLADHPDDPDALRIRQDAHNKFNSEIRASDSPAAEPG